MSMFQLRITGLGDQAPRFREERGKSKRDRAEGRGIKKGGKQEKVSLERTRFERQKKRKDVFAHRNAQT